MRLQEALMRFNVGLGTAAQFLASRRMPLSPTSTLIGRDYFAYHAVAFLEIPRGYYRFFGRRIGGMNVIRSEGSRVVREGAV